MARIQDFEANLAFDIFPILIKIGLEFERRKRSVNEIDLNYTQEQYHVIYKRDSRLVSDTKIDSVVTKQPIDLYVELLVVTDSSIFNDHQRYANTTNKDLVFLHMRIYFAHYFYIP